jgi:hypothetical protein
VTHLQSYPSSHRTRPVHPADAVRDGRVSDVASFARSAGERARQQARRKSVHPTTLAATVATVALLIWMVSFDSRTESLYGQPAGTAGPASFTAAQSHLARQTPDRPTAALAFQDRAPPLEARKGAGSRINPSVLR